MSGIERITYSLKSCLLYPFCNNRIEYDIRKWRKKGRKVPFFYYYKNTIYSLRHDDSYRLYTILLKELKLCDIEFCYSIYGISNYFDPDCWLGKYMPEDDIKEYK